MQWNTCPNPSKLSTYSAMVTLFVLCIVFGQASRASLKCPESPLPFSSRDYSGIENYLTVNEFNDIECFIQSLPEDIRAFRTYAKKSLSLQEASLKNPRAIIGSPDGGFFMTFNGDAKQKGFDGVEFIALDRNQGPKEWIAGSIKLKNGKLQIFKDDGRCTACHGSPIRPIWSMYPHWPALYGAIDDWLPDPKNPGKDSNFYVKDTSETSDNRNGDYRLMPDEIKIAIKDSLNFRKFRKEAIDHPRYSALEKASDNSSPVYPYTEVYRNRNSAFRPNFYFGQVMARRQHQILAQRILKNGFYQNYKNSILLRENCHDETLIKDKQNVIDRLSTEYEKRFAKPAPSNPEPYEGKIEGDSLHFPELFGVEPHEFTFHLANTVEFLNRYDNYYFTGSTTILPKVFERLLVEELSQWSDNATFLLQNITYFDPYQNLQERIDASNYFSYYLSKYLGEKIYKFTKQNDYVLRISGDSEAPQNQQDAMKEMCSQFSERSQQELADPIFYTQPKEKPAPSPHSPPALIGCIECHDSGKNIGLDIPFSNPKELVEFGEKKYGKNKLESVIRAFTDPQGLAGHQNGLRMPLGRKPLSPEEVQHIMVWIQKGKGAQ